MEKVVNSPSRVCARASKEVNKDGDGVSSTNEFLRSRAHAREAFYGPAICSDADSATDFALRQTGGSVKFRGIWRYYCLKIGINTFLDQLDIVISCYRHGEIDLPAQAFHARIRRMKTQLDRSMGGAK